MDNIINFRKARKKLAKRDKEKQAEKNKILYGLTKVAKKRLAREKNTSQKALDQKKLEENLLNKNEEEAE